MSAAIQAIERLEVSSEAFGQNDLIPKRYTCDGVNHNPPLFINDIPENTQSLALIVDDPDAKPKAWIHWIVWNIPVTKKIPENSIPGVEGTNDFRRTGYGGPCPPSGIHRYVFKVFALDTKLDLPAGSNALELEKKMKNHILAKGELVANYQRTLK